MGTTIMISIMLLGLIIHISLNRRLKIKIKPVDCSDFDIVRYKLPLWWHIIAILIISIPFMGIVIYAAFAQYTFQTQKHATDNTYIWKEDGNGDYIAYEMIKPSLHIEWPKYIKKLKNLLNSEI